MTLSNITKYATALLDTINQRILDEILLKFKHNQIIQPK